ncbi:MAG: hypothetical protein K2G90_04940 [Muribaculaceae bacterium]|nr:hypothetical protein [Muribaculaceae bacterium]
MTAKLAESNPRLAFYFEHRSGDGDLSFEQSDKSIRRYKELTVLYALWGGIFSNSYPEPLAPSALIGAIVLFLTSPARASPLKCSAIAVE